MHLSLKADVKGELKAHNTPSHGWPFKALLSRPAGVISIGSSKRDVKWLSRPIGYISSGIC